MKKILAIVLNFLATILTGVAFALGSLTLMYQFEKATENHIGNFYEVVWSKAAGKFSVLSLVLFFVLCVAALVVTVTLAMNKKKWVVCNALSSLLLLASGVGMFFVVKFYQFPFSGTTIPFVLGEGAIAMGVVLLVAGVFQALKTALTVKVEE